MNPVTSRRAPSRPLSDRWKDIRNDPAPEDNALQARIDYLHAEVFDTPSGRELLNYLRSITIERRNQAGDSDGALREQEACRRFVAILEMRAARHWEQMAQRPKGKDAS